MFYIRKERFQEDYTYKPFDSRITEKFQDIIDDFNSLDLNSEILMVADDVSQTVLYLGEERITFSDGIWTGERPLKGIQDLYSFLKMVFANPKIGNLQAVEILFKREN